VTVITINLGVMNLLPIPALDGGQLLVCVVELIIRRPISEKVKGYINFAGLAVLMLFMVVIAAKDIISLAFRFFGG
jgi:regulator of sigma E protease